MLKVQEIRELIKLIDQSTISELSYEEKGCKIKLRKNNVPAGGQVAVQEVREQPAPVVEEVKPQAALQQAPATKEAELVKQESSQDDPNLHKIVSPMVGTFYAAPSPDEANYVKVGDNVSSSSIVCIVEAMKLFNEIEAEVEGEIVEILVENGQLVEYGQPLFLVKAQ